METAIPTWEQVIYSSPLTVSPDTLVLDAIAQLDERQSSGDDCILVVEGGKVLGILTQRDVVRVVAARMRLSRKKISQVMTQPVISISCDRDRPILTALSVMRQHQISHLPVVDEVGNLVGLVSENRLYQTIEIDRRLDVQLPDFQLPPKQNSSDREAFLSSIDPGSEQALFVIEVTASGEFRYLNFNHIAEQYTGLTYARILGKTPEEAFGTVTGAEFRQNYTRCLQAGTSIYYEEQIVFEKYTRWTLTTLSPLCNAEGKIDLIVGTATDISDRKQAEANLKQSERKFRSIFDGTFQFIGLLTTEGIIVEANQTALDAIATDRSDVVGKLFWETPWWTHSPQLQQQLQQEILRAERGELVRFEAEHLLADGTSVFVDFSLKPVLDEDEKVVMLIAEGRDITDRKRTEEALRESEQRWQFALEGSGDGVWDWNAQTDEVFYSRRWKEMLGFAEHEIGNTLSEWEKRVHPADKADVYDKIERHLRGETDRYASEHRVLCKDGTYKWILDRGQVVSRTEKGEPLRVIGMHTDISDRRLAEQKIAEQAALIDLVTDAIYVRDLDNRILFWSQGSERLYGWTAAEVVGKVAGKLFQKESLSLLTEGLDATLTKGYWQEELEQVTRFGREIRVASRWTLVRDESGNPQSILIINSDITEKKDLEQQFYRAQRLESLGTLAGGISHDLNNIFAPILMISQLLPLKVKNLDSRTKKLLKTLETSAKRGADLVKQILVFTRGTEGKQIEIQVGHLIKEVEKMSRQTFPKSIEFRTDIFTHSLWPVKADPTQLHQILINLVVNARDAMPHGGTIEITAENREIDEFYASLNLDARAGKYIEISINDTGTGIPPQILDRIFDPFFTTKEVGKGTGLGLFTVLGIVKNHGGFLQVFSKVGKGTQFQVYLPAVETQAISESEDPQPIQGNGELILIVDDEDTVRQMTTAALEENRYNILLARDGIEAIALYTKYQHKISVVFLDLMMPNMDGLTAIHTLCTMNPQVKIIATSGLSNRCQLALASGASGFLSKPYTIQELLKMLSDLLETSGGTDLS